MRTLSGDARRLARGGAEGIGEGLALVDSDPSIREHRW
jgi:hypothetical protein